MSPPMRVQQDGTLLVYPLSTLSKRVITPVVSSSPAYTAGDNVGGKLSLTSLVFNFGETVAYVDSVLLVDKDNQKAAMTLLFFSADPTVANPTDNAALTLSTDALLVTAKVDIAAANYTTIGTLAIAQVSGIRQPIVSDGTGKIFCCLVTSGTPTYTATDRLQLSLGLAETT